MVIKDSYIYVCTSIPRPLQNIQMGLQNDTTSEFRTGFHSLLTCLGVPNSAVLLYSQKLIQFWRLLQILVLRRHDVTQMLHFMFTSLLL